MAITNLRPPGDVLLGHPVEGDRRVPHVGLITRIFREVRSAGDGIRSVDGWQQRKVAARVGHLAPPEGNGILVLVPPNPVVNHPSLEVLRRPALTAVASNAAAIFTTRISRKRKRHLGD